ncbi:MAG TPA: cation:dicarboxylase symporter family transporter [Thermoanaerobaculia bacterium]
MKESTRVLLALAIGVLGGIAIAASHSASLLAAADFIAPAGTLWVNAIRMTVIPLVVSLLITGVASVSDIRAVGRLGGRTIVVFLLLLAIVAIVVIPVVYGAFAFLPKHIAPPPAEPALEERQTLAKFIASLLPPNPIAAAANGDMLPLILFTLLLALAIARSGKRVLVDFFQAVVDAMLILVRWIILLAPIGVFALVLPLAAHSGAMVAGALGFFVAAYSVACVLVIVLLYAVVWFATRIPIRRFARAAIEPQLIAFSSSSSIASLPALIDTSERELEIPNEVVGFVLPLAASMFKVAAPLSWAIGACFVGWFYGIPVGIPQLAIVAFAALFLAFAAPGVPRGGFIMLTPLFLAIGLPAEGIGLLIAVDAIPDTFASALNATGFLSATAVVGKG